MSEGPKRQLETSARPTADFAKTFQHESNIYRADGCGYAATRGDLVPYERGVVPPFREHAKPVDNQVSEQFYTDSSFEFKETG